MFSFLRRLFLWLLWKIAFGVFLAASAFALHAMWLFTHDDPDFAAVRARHLAGLQTHQSEVRAEVDAMAAKRVALQLVADTHRERASRANRLVEGLQSLESWWKRWITDREQQRKNAVQIERLQALAQEAERAAKLVTGESVAVARELARHDRELRRVEAELRFADLTGSPAAYYLNESWWRLRWFVLAGLCLYLFGASTRKLILFYVVAPRVSRGRPLRLLDGGTTYPWLGNTHTSVETALWPGEVARVKRRYLENVDEGIVRRSCFLLSWRMPLTSVLTGFLRRVDLRNARAGQEYRVAFSDRKNPANEMAVVHVPDGGSLVVRPSYLAGVVYPADQKFRMRGRWQLFRCQSWVTGQFRYVEISGPCRLIIAGRPGLRAERLTEDEGGGEPARRTRQDATIGFTPNLEYRLVRTMRFWNYYRWNHLLFDAYFVGVGFVMTQTSPQRAGHRTARWWFTVHDRSLKLLGL